MTHFTKFKIVCLFLLLATAGGYAQQTCYQIGINEGSALYNEAQRLERSGRCVEAVPRYGEALNRFRLARSCRDLPANHELEAWENRCIQGVASCGGKSDASTMLIASPGTLSFTDKGGEQLITVNTNANTWRVDRFPAWCTTQRSNNRLTVTCQENTETNSRSDKIVIVANTLTFEVTIVQEGKTPIETPDFERIKITEVKFAGKYADDTSQNYGDDLYDNMLFLLSQITCDHLSTESKNIQLDVKILDPNGMLMAGTDAGYTFSEEITLRGNLQQNDVIDIVEWGVGNGTVFTTTGTYTFEIWCAGTILFSTSFEVLPKPIPPDEKTAFTEDPIPISPTSPISPASSVSSVSPVSSISQTKFGIGVKAGLNLATITNNMTGIRFTPEMKPDFHAGLFFNVNFGYRNQKPGLFGFQPEVLYSRQGFAVDGEKINFDYIIVPLMIKLYVYEGFNVELGPWVSYLLSVNPNSTVIAGNNIQLSDLKGGKDVGLAAGIGYESDLGLVVGARYQYGLSDMAGNVAWTNQVIAISLGWKF